MSAPTQPLQDVINRVLADMATYLGTQSDTEILRDRPLPGMRMAFDRARDFAFNAQSLAPSGSNTLLSLAVAGNKV